ncbi:cytochrome P450 [Henriciella barbarensis]|uniref:Cytochrome P450 n=1 Tax=Henriciella barbarensis TaxID=86342 RepID=A0A399QT40_9PROT|nr:cytochrome P450 [Henriciella barbarensis]RIJ21651.1 cytochrome P450 [Henriciella barbarensis]
MKLISDDIVVDTGAATPVYPAIYPELETDFELSNPNSWRRGHPYELYASMRTQAPVMWSKMRSGGSRYWSVSRYEDIKSVELQPEIFSSARGGINLAVPERKHWKPEILIRASMDNLISMDEPQHMQMRIQQKDFFIPAYVAELREKVRAKVDQLCDDLEANGPTVDFVKAFSNELPLYTLCEMLGVDEADRPKIVHWMHYLEMASQFMSNPLRTFVGEPLFPFRFRKVVEEMFEYGARVMADRRVNPRNDLLTVIAHSKLENEELPQEYLDGSWLLIIFAGNDTTRNSLSGTIKLMTEFPDQRAMVLSDPSMIPQMSEEALRMVSPVKHMRRTAMEDTELNGQRIAKDEKVVMWYGAGNRDPEVFPNPDVFDMTRDNVGKHIAFGHGVHKCLGSRVAQMQLRVAYEQLFARFPKIEFTGQIKYGPNALVHAISKLEVNLYGRGNSKPTQVQVKTPATAS